MNIFPIHHITGRVATDPSVPTFSTSCNHDVYKAKIPQTANNSFGVREEGNITSGSPDNFLLEPGSTFTPICDDPNWPSGRLDIFHCGR